MILLVKDIVYGKIACTWFNLETKHLLIPCKIGIKKNWLINNWTYLELIFWTWGPRKFEKKKWLKFVWKSSQNLNWKDQTKKKKIQEDHGRSFNRH